MVILVQICLNKRYKSPVGSEPVQVARKKDIYFELVWIFQIKTLRFFRTFVRTLR